MTPGPRRGISDAFRREATGLGLGRRRLALALVVASLGMAAWALMHDAEWKVKNRSASVLGLASGLAGDLPQARAHFEAAVLADPYDWRSHRNLAALLATRLNDRKAAIKHYSYALAYAPAAAELSGSIGQRDILRMLHAGRLEEPADCLKDMFHAAEMGSEKAFRIRLAPPLIARIAPLRRDWTARGGGTVRRRDIVRDESGWYRAEAEVEFQDRSRKMVGMVCQAGEVWRVDRIVSETEK